MKGDDLAIIILGSGKSSRYGGVKQLARYKGGESLVRLACHAGIGCSPNVVLVLGANAELIQQDIARLNVKVALNANWQSGVSSSIIAGLNYAVEHYSGINRLLIMLADTPEIGHIQLGQLIQTSDEKPKHMVAASYAGVIGVPAIFPKIYWADLQSLTGDKGARSILRSNPYTLTVEMPEAALDIDSPSDLK